VLGALRLILELNRDNFADGGLLHTYATINFLHFAVLLFTICTLVLIAVSALTPKPSDEQIAGLTFATTPAAVGTAEADRGRRIDLALSAGLVLLVLVEWIYFS
jgi:SSS family solute:Na+ symporter